MNFNQYNPYTRLAYPSPPPLHGATQATGNSYSNMGLNNIVTNNLNASAGPVNTLAAQEEVKIYALVIELLDSNTREGALLELSKKREQFDDLALVLWHSFGRVLSLNVF